MRGQKEETIVVDDLVAPRFYPTLEEFQDFEGYVAKIEGLAYMHGMCIVVPPKEWAPRKNCSYDDVEHLTVQKPIRQEFTGSKGVYYGVLLETRSQPLQKFRIAAEDFSKRFAPENNVKGEDGKGPSKEDVERYYWKNIRFRRPTYGADVQGSLFDKDVQAWNPQHLNTVLDLIGGMPGVTVPYLYFGMYGASFAWHTEDMDLYSINYIHFGAPKSWYYVPQSERERFELLCRKLYASHFDECREFLRHKLAMLSPDVLTRNGVTYGKAEHHAGEFVIVFPGVYHAGFNQGFNVAESVNFGTESWLEWGKNAKPCKCRPDTVTIDCNVLEERIRQRKLAAVAEDSALVQSKDRSDESNPKETASIVTPENRSEATRAAEPSNVVTDTSGIGEPIVAKESKSRKKLKDLGRKVSNKNGKSRSSKKRPRAEPRKDQVQGVNNSTAPISDFPQHVWTTLGDGEKKTKVMMAPTTEEHLSSKQYVKQSNSEGPIDSPKDIPTAKKRGDSGNGRKLVQKPAKKRAKQLAEKEEKLPKSKENQDGEQIGSLSPSKDANLGEREEPADNSEEKSSRDCTSVKKDQRGGAPVNNVGERSKSPAIFADAKPDEINVAGSETSDESAASSESAPPQATPASCKDHEKNEQLLGNESSVVALQHPADARPFAIQDNSQSNRKTLEKVPQKLLLNKGKINPVLRGTLRGFEKRKKNAASIRSPADKKSSGTLKSKKISSATSDVNKPKQEAIFENSSGENESSNTKEVVQSRIQVPVGEAKSLGADASPLSSRVPEKGGSEVGVSTNSKDGDDAPAFGKEKAQDWSKVECTEKKDFKKAVAPAALPEVVHDAQQTVGSMAGKKEVELHSVPSGNSSHRASEKNQDGGFRSLALSASMKDEIELGSSRGRGSSLSPAEKKQDEPAVTSTSNSVLQVFPNPGNTGRILKEPAAALSKQRGEDLHTTSSLQSDSETVLCTTDRSNWRQVVFGGEIPLSGVGTSTAQQPRLVRDSLNHNSSPLGGKNELGTVVRSNCSAKPDTQPCGSNRLSISNICSGISKASD